MSQARARRTDIFIHIPKTAGSTLNRILDRNYPREGIYAAGNEAQASIDAFRALPEREKGAIRLLRGHVPYGLHEDLPQPAVYFTFLRHPVERVISLYYFIRNYPENPAYAYMHQRGLDLEGWLKDGFTMADNQQTRFLSGVFESVPFGGLTPDHLAVAERNLRERVAVVGLTERFDESLLFLRETLGWRRIYYMRHNVTARRPRREGLSPALEEGILAANRYDLALYELGRELFEARAAAGGDSFQAELAHFRVQNRRMRPFLRVYWRVRRVSVRALMGRLLGRL